MKPIGMLLGAVMTIGVGAMAYSFVALETPCTGERTYECLVKANILEGFSGEENIVLQEPQTIVENTKEVEPPKIRYFEQNSQINANLLAQEAQSKLLKEKAEADRIAVEEEMKQIAKEQAAQEAAAKLAAQEQAQIVKQVVKERESHYESNDHEDEEDDD